MFEKAKHRLADPTGRRHLPLKGGIKRVPIGNGYSRGFT